MPVTEVQYRAYTKYRLKYKEKFNKYVRKNRELYPEKYLESPGVRHAGHGAGPSRYTWCAGRSRGRDRAREPARRAARTSPARGTQSPRRSAPGCSTGRQVAPSSAHTRRSPCSSALGAGCHANSRQSWRSRSPTRGAAGRRANAAHGPPTRATSATSSHSHREGNRRCRAAQQGTTETASRGRRAPPPTPHARAPRRRARHRPYASAPGGPAHNGKPMPPGDNDGPPT